MISRRELTLGFTACIAPSIAPLWALEPAFGQARYPDRTIRLVVPFPPGGAFDAVGRPWAERIKPRLGTVVVENQGGGGSSLGASAVAHARPDGYTLLLGGSSTHVTEAILKTRPLYDPVKDLVPIVNVVVSPFALVVHPSAPGKNLSEFIEFAKANPGKLSYGHAGVGSLNHLTGELLKWLTKADIVQVPYRGSGPATADVLAAQIAMATPGLTGGLLELHRGGKLRILAVTGSARLAAAPDIPTAVEGGVPGMVSEQLIGLMVPTGTPTTIVAQIADATHKALAEPAFQQMLIEQGYAPDISSTPEKFRSALEDEIARWTPVVRSIGLRID